MEVEPRRREHAGRRGYSPRRTQSSSTRVDMYFSEVDVDVRQPRPREPVSSLTSSDDISSGYSSGEVLQSHRASQGDTLVRTSSVGARTRAKPRTTTKKTPEDAGVDSDGNDLTPSTNLSLPTPLNLVTPEQALELLLLLSQNSNVTEHLKVDRGCPVPDTVAIDTSGNTGQSGPEHRIIALEKVEPENSPLIKPEIPESPVLIKQESRTLLIKAEVQAPKLESVKLEEPIISEANREANEAINPEKAPENTEISDELCKTKFDELKQLLTEAHKAVNNIVRSQEKLNAESTSVDETGLETKREQEDNPDRVGLKRDETSDAAEESSEARISRNELETEANIVPLGDASTNPSRSSTDSLNRAGKYHKKPAPKAPMAKSEDDSEDTESQSALKATLVIKTGTLKTFSNNTATKDVFLAHAADPAKAKSKKSKRQRTKEGFSKLLTIPKSIFHSAFSKEHKEARADDSNSLTSEISESASRSNSIASQDVYVELAPEQSSDGETDVTLENTDDNDNQSNACKETGKPVGNLTQTDNQVDNINDDSIGKENAQVTNDSSVDINVNPDGKEATNDCTKIREMSQSPRAPRKLESDIY